MAEPEQVIDPNGEIDAAPDYENMTAEEADAAMIRGEGFIREEVPEPVAASEDTPDDAPVEEPVVEVSDDVAPELDEGELRLQEMSLQMEQLKADRQRFEFIASNNAGKMGHLQKQLQEATERKSAPVEDPIYQDERTAESYPVQPTSRASSRLAEEVAELRADQQARSTEQIYSEFLNQVQTDLTRQGVEQAQIEAEQNRIMEQITPTLKQRFEPFGNLGELGPKSINKVTRMVLQSAYSDVQLAKVSALRKEASERKATQIAESRIVKQAASPSGSGGKSVQEPAPKSAEQMTAEEANAALIAEYGDGSYQRPRR